MKMIRIVENYFGYNEQKWKMKMKDINKLLEEHSLSHFQYYEDKGRIIYTYESGTSLHIADFKRLIDVLKENYIKHNDIGLDVILIEDD
jgi:hypothetical protein